jgi:hypothetical protein
LLFPVLARSPPIHLALRPHPAVPTTSSVATAGGSIELQLLAAGRGDDRRLLRSDGLSVIVGRRRSSDGGWLGLGKPSTPGDDRRAGQGCRLLLPWRTLVAVCVGDDAGHGSSSALPTGTALKLHLVTATFEPRHHLSGKSIAGEFVREPLKPRFHLHRAVETNRSREPWLGAAAWCRLTPLTSDG